MNNPIEMLNLEEVNNYSTGLLQDHVERLQEENSLLDSRLLEAYNLLEEVAMIDDLENIDDVIQTVRDFLEQRPYILRPL